VKGLSLTELNWYTAFNNLVVETVLTTARRQGDLPVIVDLYRLLLMDARGTPEWRPESLSPEQAVFAEETRDYARFAYDKYTQIPEGLKDSLDRYRRAYDLDTEHYPQTQTLISAITHQLHSRNVYTLSPDVTPEGRDFVEYFLFENHKGYCVHFASAAVLLLRSAGIPARYAEGYVLSPDDALAYDGWVDMPDSRAHAWAEIYLGGMGWIPVEVTPGVQNGVVDHEAAAAITANAADGGPFPDDSLFSDLWISQELDEAQVWEQMRDPAFSESEGADGAGAEETAREMAQRLPLRLLGTAAAAVLLLAALRLVGKLRIASRRRSFARMAPNKAAIAIYGYIQKLLPYTRFAESFSGEISEVEYALVLRARFSLHALTAQDVRRLSVYADGLAHLARTNTPLVPRLIGKYLLALF
jgi:hypothetical protein